MSSLPDYKEIVELIKSGSTAEAQEKVMALRIAALELQEENLRLKDRIRELEQRSEEKTDVKDNLEFDGTVYWLITKDNSGNEMKDGPYCQLCYDKEGKTMRLQDQRETWLCFSCGSVHTKR